MTKKRFIGIVLALLTAATTQIYAQNNEMELLFHDLEAKAAAGITNTDEADPVLDRLPGYSKESVVEVLPMILQETRNPHVSVRGTAAMALWEITTRSDGKALLSTHTAIFTELVVDPDIPIRRITILAIHTLQPSSSSPLLPTLKTYLVRDDAVSTIGPGVATILMEAAPNDADSTNAVVQYMRRKDQTSASRGVLLNAIMHVAKSHNREIGKEVASYADDPDEQTSVLAIQTLQSMGKDAISDSQQSLSRIAADVHKPSGVRAAATKALSAVP